MMVAVSASTVNQWWFPFLWIGGFVGFIGTIGFLIDHFVNKD